MTHHGFGAEQSLPQRTCRTRDDPSHAQTRRQVHDVVALAHEFPDQLVVAHVTEHEFDVVVVGEVFDVAAREVIENEDLRATCERSFRDRGADEAATAGDENARGHGGQFVSAAGSARKAWTPRETETLHKDSTRAPANADVETMSTPASYRRRVAQVLLGAVFQSAGAAVCLLPLLERLGVPGWTVDPVLVCALGALALTAFGIRAWLRTSRREVFGGGMALALLALTTPLVVALYQTGGFSSPLLAVLVAVIGAAATSLGAVWNFLHTAGVLFLLTVGAVAAREGWLPATAAGATMPQLIGAFGALIAVSALAATLSARVRELTSELLYRDVRDPETDC